MKYYKNFQLKKFNSFGLNSIAKEIWFPETLKKLQDLIIKLKGKKFEVLGGGTNVLLKPQIARVICLTSMPKGLYLGQNFGVIVDTNYSTNSFISNVIESGSKGLEGLLGIPGTIGGALVMNAGSGKYSISDYLLTVTTMDYEGNTHVYHKDCLKFDRRYSRLQDKKEIVIKALFDFETGKIDQEKIKQIKNYRQNFPKGYSMGGIFKNWYALKPYEKEIKAIKSPNLVISKYLNVIINNGKATFDETIGFINQIRKIVKEPLELEVKILGDK